MTMPAPAEDATIGARNAGPSPVPALRHRSRLSRRRRIHRVVLIIILGILALPILRLVTPGAHWGTIDDVLRSPSTWRAFRTSITLAALVGISAAALGTAVAWLLVRGIEPGRLARVALIATCLPLAIPSYVIAATLISAAGAQGIPGRWFVAMGMKPLILRDAPLVWSWIILTLSTTPYVVLSVRSALMHECRCLEEAASGLGASSRQVFRTVTLPRIAPSMWWGGMLAALYALAEFGTVSLLRCKTLTWKIFLGYEDLIGIDRAHVLAMLLALLTSGISVVVLSRRGLIVDAASVHRDDPCCSPLRGKARLLWLPFAFLVGLGVVMPFITLLLWIQPATAAEAFADIRKPLLATVFYGAFAAVITAVIAGILGAARTRFVSPLWRRLVVLGKLGFAVPGLVIAVACTELGLTLDAAVEWLGGGAHRIYQTPWILLYAYVVLFLPVTLGPMLTAADRLHTDTMDASDQYGPGTIRGWLRLIGPHFRPAMIAGMALVWVSVAKELPATLLLAPPDTQTLAFDVWSSLEEGMFGQAAFSSIGIVAIGAVGLAVILRSEG